MCVFFCLMYTLLTSALLQENVHVFPKTICLDAHHIHVVRPTAYSFWPDQDVSAHIKTEDKARTSRGVISQITSNGEFGQFMKLWLRELSFLTCICFCVGR
jgi:hypothetical protein